MKYQGTQETKTTLLSYQHKSISIQHYTVEPDDVLVLYAVHDSSLL